MKSKDMAMNLKEMIEHDSDNGGIQDFDNLVVEEL